ncbi:MAG: hypothetical protein WBN57_05055 [Gammaproteobacteria bacterium]
MTPRQERYDIRIKHYNEARVGLYNAANQACSYARATERRLLIERLLVAGGNAIGVVSVIHGSTAEVFRKYLAGDAPNTTGGG